MSDLIKGLGVAVVVGVTINAVVRAHRRYMYHKNVKEVMSHLKQEDLDNIANVIKEQQAQQA